MSWEPKSVLGIAIDNPPQWKFLFSNHLKEQVEQYYLNSERRTSVFHQLLSPNKKSSSSHIEIMINGKNIYEGEQKNQATGKRNHPKHDGERSDKMSTWSHEHRNIANDNDNSATLFGPRWSF